MRHSISADVLGHFSAAWDMLGEAVTRFPAEQWARDVEGALAPARVAYHVLETAEYYFGSRQQGFPWGARFGADWETATPEALPTPAQVIAYLEEIRALSRRWLADAGDETMLAPDPVYAAEGMSRLDRALYVLRHTQHHVGELCGLLRRCAAPRPPWR